MEERTGENRRDLLVAVRVAAAQFKRAGLEVDAGVHADGVADGQRAGPGLVDEAGIGDAFDGHCGTGVGHLEFHATDGVDVVQYRREGRGGAESERRPCIAHRPVTEESVRIAHVHLALDRFRTRLELGMLQTIRALAGQRRDLGIEVETLVTRRRLRRADDWFLYCVSLEQRGEGDGIGDVGGRTVRCVAVGIDPVLKIIPVAGGSSVGVHPSGVEGAGRRCREREYGDDSQSGTELHWFISLFPMGNYSTFETGKSNRQRLSDSAGGERCCRRRRCPHGEGLTAERMRDPHGCGIHVRSAGGGQRCGRGSRRRRNRR